tara:strand:+ start:537 stop:806 length:270 start_codon:yes stop_codon:yes gene_type:complete
MDISKSYVHQVFKQCKVKLSSNALNVIIARMRTDVSAMGRRCINNNIREINQSNLWIAYGEKDPNQGPKDVDNLIEKHCLEYEKSKNDE